MNTRYCSEKFWWLTVNVEKQYVSSCCTAKSNKIDFEWLSKNPGQLFNTETFVNDRKDMLANVPVSSCDSCWDLESKGSASRRTLGKRFEITHTNPISKPEWLDLVLSSDCNMTCSYCGKQYSKEWTRDIVNNGTYDAADPRFQITPIDKAISKLSQNEISGASRVQQIMNELDHYRDVKKIDIAGGEPFLYNKLIDTISKFSDSTQISIHTGLGVNTNRFKNILHQLPLHRMRIVISAENVEDFYEFNRYGNTYENFLNNLESIRLSGVKYTFNSVISNLTIFGFKKFIDTFKENEKDINLSVCANPAYLSPMVMDEESFELIKNTDYGRFNSVIGSMFTNTKYKENEKQQLANFLREFARRRNLDLSIFPTSFINWLKIN